MPNEVSIAKHLSGTEALEACMISIRNTLSRDDRFAPHMAYSGFRATIEFKFYGADGFIPPIERSHEIVNGTQEGLPEEPIIDEKIELPVRPPNEVREAAGMPTPVLVTDGQGRTTEKWVTRTDRPRSVPTVPKNKTVGGDQR